MRGAREFLKLKSPIRVAGMLGLACSLATVSFLAGFEVTARRYEATAQGLLREEGLRKVRNQLQQARESVAREEARATALAEWLLAVVDPDVPLQRDRDGRLPSFYRRQFLDRLEMGIWSAVIVLRASEGMGRPWMSRMATSSTLDEDSAEAIENWAVGLLHTPDESVSMMRLSSGDSIWRISHGRLWWLSRSSEGDSGQLLLAVARASPIPANASGWLWSNSPGTPLRLDSFGGNTREERDPGLFPRPNAGEDWSAADAVREHELVGDGVRRIRGLSAVSRGARWLVSWEFEVPRHSSWYVEARSIGLLLAQAAGALGFVSLVLLISLELRERWKKRPGKLPSARSKTESKPVAAPAPKVSLSAESSGGGPALDGPPAAPTETEAPAAATGATAQVEATATAAGTPNGDPIHGVREEVVLLHLRIRELQNWLADRELEIDSVHEARQWTSDAVELRAKENDGQVTSSSEGGYVILFWGGEIEGAAGPELAALRCALALRSDLVILNAARKNEGSKLVHFEMGLHRGLVFRPSSRREEIWGPALDAVRGLSECAGVLGRDLVIGANVAAELDPFAELVQLGDARVHAEIEDTSIFTAKGLKGSVPEKPGEFETFDSRTTAWSFGATLRESRWWVDNGSRLLGPLSAADLGHLLISQELDFDSTCWNSERGEKLPIGQARIFGSAAPDGEHRFWLYDGQQIHGPLNAAFLRTSHERGWVPESALVCDTSTVTGWLPLGRWLVESAVAAESTAITASTAAPPDRGSAAA